MKVVRIKRSAVVDTTPTEGNLVRIQKPEFVTLVGKPANQTGFKVVRSEQPEGEKTVKPTIRRTKRSEVNPVLSLAFPAGTTAEDVAATLANYGMEGYKVSETEGVFTALRGDLQSIAKEGTVSIKLTEEGITATVARSDATETPNPLSGVAVSQIEFDHAKISVEDANAWLQRNSIDSAIAADDNSGKTCVVRRSDVAEGTESRTMELEAGITATIIRADVNDIPDGYYAVINECAYGNWGWGHLDFNAATADAIFSEQAREALYRLEEVLRNIMFYSPLPIDVRKTLANNALVQYGAFVSNLMDSLPRQLLVAVTRSAQPQLENQVTKQTADAGAQAAQKTETQTEAPLTRADVATLIAEGVKAGLEAAGVKRADEAAPKAEGEAAPAAAATEATAAPITRSDLEAVVTAATAAAVAPINERLAKMEGTTVLRSDTGDAATQPAAAASEEPAGTPEQKLFRGALFGRLASK